MSPASCAGSPTIRSRRRPLPRRGARPSRAGASAMRVRARSSRRPPWPRQCSPCADREPRRISRRSASRSPRRQPTIRRWRCRRTARRSPSSRTRIACRCSGSARSTPSRAARCRAPKAPAFRSGRRTAARIGFFADDKLKRIDVAGGTPLVVADAPNARGGTWNADGVILFAPGVSAPIMRVPARGGPVGDA